MSRFLSFLLCITLTGNFLSVQTLQAADSEVGTLDISLASSTDTMSFVGIKKSRTTKILDDFKENSKVLLFEKGVFTEQEEEGIFDAGEEVRNLEQMMNRIEESKESLKEQKLEVTSRKFTLQDMLSELESEIVTHTSEIVDAEEHIRIKNKSIADTLRHIVVLQDRIDSNKSAILDYLGYLYGKGNIIMNEGNDIDIVRTLVLTDGNVSDILADYQFQMLIEVTGQNFLEERRSLLRDLYTETQTLKSDKARVIELKQKLEIEKIALQEQQIFKQKLLELTQGQEALFNEYIADRQEKQQKIESRMREVVDRYDTAFGTIAERSGCILEKSGDIRPKVLTNTTACNELAQVYALEKRLREWAVEEVGANPIVWPVTPSYISAYYKDADYFDSVGSSHDGIDIPTPQGTELQAPMEGYVSFINEPVEGGYGYMAIKHPNGFLTVYGHISEVLVPKYTYLKAGEVFAKSGGAPGTKWAGVMTSGAHLHLELYQGKDSVDPLRYMDLTRLRFESLTTKYKYKFIEDLKLRYGYMANTTAFNTFKVSGDTEIDRQKNLLENYAAPNFRSHEIWTEEAVEAKIDPSFLICIGLAETGLGRNLKTPFNVGNIGNTDSGATSEFISARDGIYWMGKTLNNKFLGHYQSVSDLSRWGNKTGSIYASSSKSWQENNIRCLSALKGRFVEDDYKFRLSPEEITPTK